MRFGWRRLARKTALALAALWFFSSPTAALAGACEERVAATPLRLASASADWAQLLSQGEVRISFLGHASFLIESPGGVAIVTDYNGFNRPPFTPDIVTMNIAHATHNTNQVAGIRFPLKGWDTNGVPAHHDLEFRDVRVSNLPTSIRGFGGDTRVNGNSIFIFNVADLCIAHLGHLHHTLTPADLQVLGRIDVLLVPVDGAWTMSQDDMMEVIQQIKPKLIIPMHFFGTSTLARFLERIALLHPVKISEVASVVTSRARLPNEPEVLVLPGY
ncbi:MAG: MBL fold metallo-hydrolase [Proteobacteria bacterium]|nr:MBL fold metallo-hydrolase [Pseudomonadota bacterium]MBI3499928.1 MBL fold metallo-hydrolase [Pseudomonadota bacterium]